MTYAVSTVVVLLLGTGLYFRKRNTTLHRGLMIAAFMHPPAQDRGTTHRGTTHRGTTLGE